VKRRTLERFAIDLKPIAGVRAAVEALAAHPRCVASSSSLERIGMSLTATGLLDLFAGRIYSATLVARSKPAPDVFLHAARSMGAAPADCVVIEDSLPGVTGAVAAGMRVIGFCGGAHVFDAAAHGAALRGVGASVAIVSMDELPAAVASFAP
jgi:HAD superfamily hydrolase (TIGR01509 family)